MGDQNPISKVGIADVRTMRCPHCSGPLTKEMETSEWTVPPLIRDSFSMIGSAVGGTAGAFYGFNHVMPIVRRWIKGPMWLHFLVGAPPVIIFSSGCAGLAGIFEVAIRLQWLNHERSQDLGKTELLVGIPGDQSQDIVEKQETNQSQGHQLKQNVEPWDPLFVSFYGYIIWPKILWLYYVV